MSKPSLTPPVGPDDHSLGGDDFDVTLVEYGDFECPYCGAAYPVLKRVQERMGRRLRFVYRHFAIADSHPHAEAAAEASESVAALNGPDAFWRMHDVLFEHQHALKHNDLAHYATIAGAAPEIVLNDLEEGRYRQRVRDSFLSGFRSGVNGTPTLFMNGVRYDGPGDEDSLIEALTLLADQVKVGAR